MFYLHNYHTGANAHECSDGEDDGMTTNDLRDAASFHTWSEAAEYSQNFCCEWLVQEL